MEKLTDWYPMSTHPVREGMYKVMLISDTVVWGRWNGFYWTQLSPRFDSARIESEPSDWCVNGRASAWRGLAEDPATAEGVHV